jgi:hypothetical protein
VRERLDLLGLAGGPRRVELAAEIGLYDRNAVTIAVLKGASRNSPGPSGGGGPHRHPRGLRGFGGSDVFSSLTAWSCTPTGTQRRETLVPLADRSTLCCPLNADRCRSGIPRRQGLRGASIYQLRAEQLHWSG